MSKPAPRTLEVIRSRYLTPHMLRITLGGAGLADFPEDQASAYIKLIFPQPAQARPLMRTYTISAQRSDEIDVDFVLHATDGPASAWARRAKPGEQILVGGPGLKKLINHDADWFLLVGDMSALPAITVNLAQLPDHALGYAVLEVLSEADIQPLTLPRNMEVHWVVNGIASSDTSALLERVEQLDWLVGQPAVWVAGEFHSVRALRRYFKRQHPMEKSHIYQSSYWKINSTEDQHKIAKQHEVESGDN